MTFSTFFTDIIFTNSRLKAAIDQKLFDSVVRRQKTGPTAIQAMKE